MFLDTTSSAATTTGTGQASTDAKKLQTDLNRFLTLLVTQLQHQDPLQPMDANQFTSQLVQFADVEQQIYQNANLEKLLAAQKTNAFASSLGYLGTRVEGSGSTLPLQDGVAEGSYTLPATASKAVLTVKDGKGATIYTEEMDTTAGRHEFQWDGRGSNGTQFSDGAYTFKVSAQDASGKTLDVKQSYFGQVTGIADETTGTVLEMGAAAMPLTDVVAIRDTTKG